MKKLYQLKVLAWVGVTTLVALLLWMVVACLIPTFHAPEFDQQLYTIRHQDLRDNNPLYTDLLLKSIKKNNGYLVLGTSESHTHENANYFDFLNEDTSLHCGFSVIAGAGRTPCVYFPLIQSNDNVKGLKVIFFLNPAYGCGKVASSNVDYFNRYVSPTIYKRSNHPKNQDVDDILQKNKGNILDRIEDELYYHFDNIRRKYYQDLRFRIHEEKFSEELTWINPAFVESLPSNGDRPDSSQHNYQLNVSADFDVHSYTLHPHPEETYRADELRTMIQLCKERSIDIVFVAGPYNHIAFAQVHPDELPKMQQVTKDMLRVLNEEGAKYIDCTDLSTVPGTFRDWQHHTSYGGYLIYQRIKDYVEKENR